MAWLLMALGGWLVLLALGAWGLLVDTNVTTGALTSLVQSRVGPGLKVKVRDFGFAPLGRELVLHGVTLEGLAGRLEIERLRLFVGWKAERGLGIDGIVAEGGTMFLSEPFLGELSQINDQETPAAPLSETPPLQVDGVEVHVRTEEGDWANLGVLDMGAQSHRGIWTVQGKLEDAPTTNAPLLFHSTIKDKGQFQARAACEGILLELLQDQPWMPAEFGEQLASWQASGPVQLRANLVRGDKDQSLDVHLEMGLNEGHAILPPHNLGLPNADFPVDGNLDLQAALHGDLRISGEGQIEDLSMRARATLGLGDLQATVLARAGGEASPNQDLEVWLEIPRMDWEQELLPLLGRAEIVADLEGMLQPKGGGQALAWLTVPQEAWKGERPEILIPRQIVIRPHEETSAAYIGSPNLEAGGVRNTGFPARVTNLSGLVLHGFTPSDYLGEELALVDLRGQHPTGPARVAGMFRIRGNWRDQSPPEQHAPMEMLLSIAGEQFDLGEDLFAGLDGLAGIETVRLIRPEYDPQGGSIDFDLVLQNIRAHQALSTDLRLNFKDTSFHWAAGDLNLNQATGQVLVQVTPVSLTEQSGAVRLNLSGFSAPFTTKTDLKGMISFGPEPGRASWLQFGLEGIDLSSPAVAELFIETDARMGAGLTEQISEAVCSATISAWRAEEQQPFTLEALLKTQESGLSVQVLGEQVAPVRLTTQASLRGLLALDGEPFDASGLRLALRARSPEFTVPLVSVSSPSEALDTWQARVFAAGIDAADPSLSRLIQSSDKGRLTITGFVDASAQVQPGQETSTVNLWVDCERITLPGFQEELGPVRGQIELTGEGLITSPHLELSMAGANAILTDLVIDPRPGKERATTAISAQNIHLGEKQLNLLLGAETAGVLIDELQAKGLLSIESGILAVHLPQGGSPKVRFDGRVSLLDASMTLGLPIEVQRLGESEVTLISEDNEIRVRVKVADLNASLAGRTLEGASFQATFIKPRLVIEDFSAGFEGGRLETQGLSQANTASFFSMDLAAPFPFSLSAIMRAVDVGRLTRGIFQSEFANEGRLDGNLRLSGELGNLLGVRGTGRIELKDSALWAIPVFQALFATLGFDSTATFGSMETWLKLEGGVINMSGMRLKSDILSLVGDGTLDMEGELDYSMEVRYSLVDKFGLVNKIIYLLQDELIRISIEGDMGRPAVVARGILSRFTSHERQGRRLPIPPLSTLPRVW
jgi:hypothetical protein